MNGLVEPQAYFRGRFVPASAVAISPTDTGFVQGVTVAEQLRTFAGRLFHLEEHLARLEHSLQAIGVDPGMDRSQMVVIATELVARNHPLLQSGDDLGLSIFVTPGEYPGYTPPGPRTPLVCLHTYPLQFRHWAAKYRAGQSLVTTEIRQVPADCWPVGVKCRSRMHYYLADHLAAQADPGARALLLDHQGRVTEASTANVLLLRRGELVAPARTAVLQGISLHVIEQLANRLGLPTVERDFGTDLLSAADEVFLTSTPFCVLPVTRFNRLPIGDGKPGPFFCRLLDAWNAQVGLDIAAQAERFATRV